MRSEGKRRFDRCCIQAPAIGRPNDLFRRDAGVRPAIASATTESHWVVGSGLVVRAFPCAERDLTSSPGFS